MPLMVKLPELSVTNLPLASPTTLPSARVTRNSTSDKGLPVAASTFFTSRLALGLLPK